MKYLLSLIALLAFNLSYAQTFQWNKKSAEPMPQEVQPNDPARIAYEKAFNERQLGMAGVYNPTFQGQRTSYGETYANRQMTASHPVLPLGTIVRVQNLDNNRVASVRINDKGQECADCLLTLSQEAATHLGINYRGRVAVERTGFSNWNPAPPTQQRQAVSSTPQTYQQPTTVTQPVQINRANQWQSRGGTTAPAPATTNNSPLAYGNQTTAQAPATYSRPSAYGSVPAAGDNYAVLNAPATPSVTSREVQPATVSRQPVTYSRYPTAATPTPAPANNQARTYEPAPRAYSPPVYQQQSPAPVPQQAAPPASTVMRYQEQRTVPAPATYNTPAVASPRPYVPPTQQARSVAVPATSPVAAAAPASGYVVQLGAYSNEVYAKNRVAQLNQLGMANVFYKSVQKPDGQMINRVYAGTYGSMAEAQTAARLIQGNYQIAGIVSSL